MHLARFGTPGVDDIVVTLRRLARHFEVLAGLGAGPSFEEVAATCKAAAAELDRLRDDDVDAAGRESEHAMPTDVLTMIAAWQGGERRQAGSRRRTGERRACRRRAEDGPHPRH